MLKQLILLVTLVIGKVVCQNFVCLKAVVIKNQLLLECKIDIFAHNVEFVTPNGSSYGSCNALTPPELEANDHISCGNNITQYIDRKTTVLRLEKPTEWLGVWTCKHGSGLSNDTINITSLFIEQNIRPDINNKPTTCSNDNRYCVGLASVISPIFLIVGFLLSYLEPLRTSVDSVKDDFIGWFKRRRGTREDIEFLHHFDKLPTKMNCQMCKQSACSLCVECVAYFCGVCFNVHQDKYKDHDVCTFEPPLKAKGKFDVKCLICNDKQCKYHCITHKRLVCTSCDCRRLEDLVTKCERIRVIPPTDQAVEEIKTTNIKCIRDIDVKDKTVFADQIRICGLCTLPDNILVIADTNSKEILWFQKFENKGKMQLPGEPKGLVHLFDTRFAISFPHIVKIGVYDFKDQIPTEIDTIDMSEYGKPISMAYNDDCYAVEIGEGDSGYIGIFKDNGKIWKEIRNFDSAYFTGNTIRLALDTKHEKVFVSALGVKLLYCLNFSGEEVWNIEMPSPRGVLWIPDIPDGNGKVLVASKRNDVIYKVNPEDGKREIIVSDSSLNRPRYMTCDKAEKLLYVHVHYGKIRVHEYPSDL